MGSIGTEQYTYTNGTLTKISFANQDVWELDAENSLGQTTSVNSGPLTRTTAYASNGLLTGITFANVTAPCKTLATASTEPRAT